MSNQYETEIVRLHDFFVAWFTGRLPNTAEAFAQFASATGPDFHIISPQGTLNSRGQIVDSLRAAHGRMSDIKIWIENVTIRQEWDNHAIITYEEWQTSGEKTTARLSTVVFRATKENAYGLHWLHVHETWLPQ